jgi:hypothetical protein
MVVDLVGFSEAAEDEDIVVEDIVSILWDQPIVGSQELRIILMTIGMSSLMSRSNELEIYEIM